MRILFILLLLVSCSKDVKVPFISKDPAKPINVIIENEFDITYSLLTLARQNDVCQMTLEIKNISKEEKRNSLSIEAYSFADKKYEAFVVEKRSKPNEIINSTVQFNGINCGDLRKINFYKWYYKSIFLTFGAFSSMNFSLKSAFLPIIFEINLFVFL